MPRSKIYPTKIYLADGGMIILPIQYVGFYDEGNTPKQLNYPIKSYVAGKKTSAVKKCKKICQKVSSKKVSCEEAKTILTKKEKNYLKKHLYALTKQEMKKVKKVYELPCGKVFLTKNNLTYVMIYGKWCDG
ncbi:MAG: hypothetical protein K6G65_10565, partial [Lachnospiraceae bacterium]|nr:hypothetical protein [Lachnospiraceae bacterium]